MNKNSILKLVIGVLISAIFLYFAFGRIDFNQMKASFVEANYWYLIPAFLIMVVSHWIRAIRLRYLIPVDQKLSVFQLFSAIMVGYAGNAILPAHLGEVVKANVIAKKYHLSTTTVLASVLVERLIDTLTLLVVMVFAIIIYPFPKWVTQSGYLLLGATIFLFIVLILLKKKERRTYAILNFFLSILPRGISTKLSDLITSFVDGIGGLKRKRDLFFIIFYSLAIWAMYWLVFVCVYYAFDIFATYQVNLVSSLVLLVITTISIIVPSSPGYIGTYHLLCQISLGLFGVPESVGLSFAVVAHAISTFGAAAIGGIFAWKEGVNRFRGSAESGSEKINQDPA